MLSVACWNHPVQTEMGFDLDRVLISLLLLCQRHVYCVCCSCVIVGQDVFFVGGGPIVCTVKLRVLQQLWDLHAVVSTKPSSF